MIFLLLSGCWSEATFSLPDPWCFVMCMSSACPRGWPRLIRGICWEIQGDGMGPDVPGWWNSRDHFLIDELGGGQEYQRKLLYWDKSDQFTAPLGEIENFAPCILKTSRLTRSPTPEAWPLGQADDMCINALIWQKKKPGLLLSQHCSSNLIRNTISISTMRIIMW